MTAAPAPSPAPPPPAPSAVSRQPNRRVLIAALLILIGGLLRVPVAVSDPLWLDELHTAWTVNGSLAQVAPRAAAGNQTPLYFWLTWLASQLLGSQPLGLRSISLISGIALIALAGTAVWRWTGSGLATGLAMTLISWDETFVRYATEARPYALLQCLGLLHLVLLLRWVKSIRSSDAVNSSRWTRQRFQNAFLRHGPLVFTSWALVYTHLTGALLFLPEAIFVVVALLTRGGIRLLPLVVVPGLVIVGLLPVGACLEAVADRRQNWESIASLPWLASSLATPLLIWGLASVPLILWSRRRWPRDSRGPELLLVTAAMGVFLAIVWIQVIELAPLALPRYYAVAAAAPPVLAALVIGSLRPTWARGVAACGIGLLTAGGWAAQDSWPIAVVKQQRLPAMRGERWQIAVDQIESDARGTDWPLFLFAATIEDADAFSNADPDFQAYLQFPIRGLAPSMPDHRPVIAGPTLDRQHFRSRDLQMAVRRGGAWLLIRHHSGIVDEIVDQCCRQLRDLEPPHLRSWRLDVARLDPGGAGNGLVVLVRVTWMPPVEGRAIDGSAARMIRRPSAHDDGA